MNPVVWFEIYVDDIQRAKKFYETVLGVLLSDMPMPTEELEKEHMQMISFPSFIEGGGAAGALVKMPGFQAGGGSTIVYFGCQDCGVETSRVEAAGGKIFKPKFSIGEFGFCSLVVDTEGNMIGLYSQA